MTIRDLSAGKTRRAVNWREVHGALRALRTLNLEIELPAGIDTVLDGVDPPNGFRECYAERSADHALHDRGADTDSPSDFQDAHALAPEIADAGPRPMA